MYVCNIPVWLGKEKVTSVVSSSSATCFKCAALIELKGTATTPKMGYVGHIHLAPKVYSMYFDHND